MKIKHLRHFVFIQTSINGPAPVRHKIDFTRSHRYKTDGYSLFLRVAMRCSVRSSRLARSISKPRTNRGWFSTPTQSPPLFHLAVRVPSTVKSPFFPVSVHSKPRETPLGYRASVPISGSCH